MTDSVSLSRRYLSSIRSYDGDVDDTVLLVELVEQLFDSREEAEHYAQCGSCSLFGEDPYRCSLNPVEIREAGERQVKREQEQVVWLLRGMPPRTEDEQMRHDFNKSLRESMLASIEHGMEMERLILSGQAKLGLPRRG